MLTRMAKIVNILVSRYFPNFYTSHVHSHSDNDLVGHPWNELADSICTLHYNVQASGVKHLTIAPMTEALLSAMEFCTCIEQPEVASQLLSSDHSCNSQTALPAAKVASHLDYDPCKDSTIHTTHITHNPITILQYNVRSLKSRRRALLRSKLFKAKAAMACHAVVVKISEKRKITIFARRDGTDLPAIIPVAPQHHKWQKRGSLRRRTPLQPHHQHKPQPVRPRKGKRQRLHATTAKLTHACR